MNFNIIAPGRLKEKYLRDACFEYEKRLSGFGKVKVLPFNPEVLSQQPSPAEISKALEKEAENIKKHVLGYSIALCIEGKQLSSEEFSKKIENIAQSGNGNITFIIGSSYGLDERLKSSCDFKMSLSKMTFPHQLFRVMLLEQIYRAEMIIAGRKYHK